MVITKHEKSGHQAVERRSADLFESFFGDWPALFRRPFVVVPEGSDTIRADEYTEDGTLVVKVEIGGIDPEKDVDVSLDGDVLHIEARRRQEEEKKERDYMRRELRYGSFHRDLLVPAGTTDADVKASYKDGILEVRVPTAAAETAAPPAAKIPVAKG